YNPNNMLPIVTALQYQNYDAAKLFFEKTGSLFASMTTLDGEKVSLIDYLFYNAMDAQVKAADIPVKTFFKSLVNGYKQSADGIPEIKTIIESGDLKSKTQAPIVTKNGQIQAGSTMVHIAAYTGKYDSLIKAAAFYNDKTNILNLIDSNGETPLHIAVRQGNYETAKVLLEAGAYIDLQNYSKTVPLSVAISQYSGDRQADIVKLLLTSAANTKYNYDLMLDENSIELAKKIKAVNNIMNKYNVMEGDISVRRYLLSQAKWFAEENLNPQIVRIMQGGIDNRLKFASYYEVDPFPKGATPLIASAIACSKDTAKYLILAKADTDIRITGKNDLKYDAYDFADRVSNCEEVKTMLKNPASLKVNMQDFYQWDIETTEAAAESQGVFDVEPAETVQENNADEPYAVDNGSVTEDNNSNDGADVELIIEEEN
ncbi:MAG: ankyrin repeat domain-containing protein, partial [Candidatus Mucispirillum faecigallinarum]|nr:ankyrin repeat domain-containing protein [Candidatus Mucispirillum faecigallinarum]